MTPLAAGPRRSPPSRAPSPPTSRDAGAGRCDRPGRLRPERHRSRAADLPATDPDKLVPVADAGGNDVDEDLACGRPRQLVHLEDLDGLAECCDPGRSHPVRRTLLASVMRRGPLW